MKKSGTTLLEVLIAFGILVLVLVLAFKLFNPSLGYFRAGMDLSEVQRNLILAQKRLLSDIAEARREWVTNQTLSSPPALALPSARDSNGVFQYTGQAEPDWQKWIIYYLYPDDSAEENLLVRKEYSSTFPPEILPWQIPSGLTSTLGANAVIVCRYISRFEVQNLVSPDSTPYFLVILETTITSSGGRNSILTQKVVYPKL